MKGKTETLRELGFTDGEIKIYFSLFDLGETTTGPISKKSGVTHSKVYPILAKLIDKGLASHVIKENKKHYSATNPNSLIEFVEKKQRTLEEEKSELKEMIPSLIAKQETQEQIQYARVFEGTKGLRSLFHELFGENKEETEIRVLGLNEILKEERIINFFQFYHTLRLKKNIKLKLILSKNIKDFHQEHYTNPKILGKKDKVKYFETEFPTGVFIFKDHVINIIADKKVTVFDIKSKQNAKRFRDFFEKIWETTK